MVTTRKQAWYRYEAPKGKRLAQRLTRPVINDDAEHDQLVSSEVLKFQPDQVQTLLVEPDGEYLLFIDEFPGLMDPGRDEGWGRFVYLRPYEPPAPIAAPESLAVAAPSKLPKAPAIKKEGDN